MQTYFDYCELKGEVNIAQPQQFFNFHPSGIFTKVHKSIQGANQKLHATIEARLKRKQSLLTLL
jgi:hypothetical protein